MESPKAMQNMRMGVVESRAPVAVKFNALEKWPSWKIQTIAPNVALRLKTLSTSAFAGTTTLPNIRNSNTKVKMAISPMAQGIVPNSDAFWSTNWADAPPTRTGNGRGAARTAFTNASPWFDNGSMDGTTDR